MFMSWKTKHCKHVLPNLIDRFNLIPTKTLPKVFCRYRQPYSKMYTEKSQDPKYLKTYF